MTAVAPDPWDECATCGHDRDDHTGPGGLCVGRDVNPAGFPALIACSCRGFVEEEDG